METRIQAIRFDISSQLTDFINRKAEKLARRNPAISHIDFTLKVVKPETAMNKEASATVTVPGQKDIAASKIADTFEEAVDMVLEAIDRQLEKEKDKK